MRIITGKAKGKKLYQIRTKDIRPTSDKVKESLFNIIGDKILEASFLDLFSGSASVSLEAFSRGAEIVKMVDNSILAKKMAVKNIEICGFSNFFNKKIFFFNRNAEDVIALFFKRLEKFDLIFIDPPYKDAYIYDTILKKIDKNCILEDNGSIILEHYYKYDLRKKYKNLKFDSTRRLGDNSFSFYKLR